MRKILEEELKALEEEEGEEPEIELDEDEVEDKEMAEIDDMIARASEEEKAALKKYNVTKSIFNHELQEKEDHVEGKG